MHNMQDQYAYGIHMPGGFFLTLRRTFIDDSYWRELSGSTPWLSSLLAGQLRAIPAATMLALTLWLLRGTRWLGFYIGIIGQIGLMFTYITISQFWHAYLILTFTIWVLWLRGHNSPPSLAKRVRHWRHGSYPSCASQSAILFTITVWLSPGVVRATWQPISAAISPAFRPLPASHAMILTPLQGKCPSASFGWWARIAFHIITYGAISIINARIAMIII